MNTLKKIRKARRLTTMESWMIEYEKFLDTKMKDLLDKIKNNPKLLAVFKRLHDR